jgi:TonB family protein
MKKQCIFAGSLVILLAGAHPLAARQASRSSSQSTPPPWGQRFQAHDGDVVMIDGDDRVRIVRRRQAMVRAIANDNEHWVTLLVDFVRDGKADGSVDRLFWWRDVQGKWPLPERYDGGAILEEYTAPGQAPGGFGIVVPEGRVQLLPGGPASGNFFIDSRALAVLNHRSASNSMTGGISFEDAERRALDQIAANPRSDVVVTNGSPGATVRLQGPTMIESGMSYSTLTPGAGPVRVGGNIAMPRRVIDAAADYPEEARKAGIRGVVILEVTVGSDGAVTEARVLRGQPMLDQAALDAARKWRYEPTLLNGSPVPVRFTATVSFGQ